MRRVPTALARPARTAGQGGLGFAVMAVIQSFHPFTPEQYGALTLLLTIVFGWVQVVVENRLGKAVLRDVPSRTAPLVDETPEKPTASSDEFVMPRTGTVSTTRAAVAKKKATPRRRRSSPE